MMGCDDADERGADGPIDPRICALEVAIAPKGLPARVGLDGPFGGDRLEDAYNHALVADDSGVWRGRFDVPPGLVPYRFIVDGRPVLDETSTLSLRKGGQPFSAAYVDDCRAPGLSKVRLDVTPDGDVDIELAVWPAIDRAEPATAAEITLDGTSVPALLQGNRVRVKVRSVERGKHRLVVRVVDAVGRVSSPFEAPFWVETPGFDWRDAIIYQVMIDRFAADEDFGPAARRTPSGDRFGGHIRGLLRVMREGYFDQLGVNVLWISPLNTNADGRWVGVEGGAPRYESYHGYWPTQARDVDPRFGRPEDVEALVDEAHRRGIRVIMDAVLNHVHIDHPYVAEHPDWFATPPCVCGSAECPWYSHIETCWFTSYLPDIDWNDVDVLERQIDDALWWMSRFDLDGLRIDAVPMMPRFVTRHLTARLHRRFEGLGVRHYLLGETFTGADGRDEIRWYLGPFGLDGQFDFPLMWATRAAFAWEATPLWALDDSVAESEEAWRHSSAVMGLMIGNHDVTRFMSEAAGQVDAANPEQRWQAPPPLPDSDLPYARQLLAQAFVLTIPGAPILYYGDEFGQPGVADPDNRRPMRFDDERSARERSLFAQVSAVARARRCLPALRRGRYHTLRAEAERLIYVRDDDDGAPAFVVLHRGDTAVETEVPIPSWLHTAETIFIDVSSGTRISRQGDALSTFTLAPRTPAVFVPASSPCVPPRFREDADR